LIRITNYLLQNLEGLQSLETIGTNLFIEDHYSLQNLDGLANLTTIGGLLHVCQNNILTSLTGLDSISPNSISDLEIFDNPDLATCHVQSICDYLASPSGTVEIHDNGPGCDSPTEVEEACLTGFSERNSDHPAIIFPNPATKTIAIITSNHDPINEVFIYDLAGELVSITRQGEAVIDVSMLSPGLYFLEVMVQNIPYQTKLIIK